MDAVDRDLEKAETEASPERFPTQQPDERFGPTGTDSSSSSDAADRVQRVIGASVPRQPSEFERHPTELRRQSTLRTVHAGTVGKSKDNVTSRRDSGKPLLAFGGGKPFPLPLPEREEYVVEFDGPNDPLHAQNWPMLKKVSTGSMLAFTTFVAAWGSSIFSPTIDATSKRFHVSPEVATLGLSLFVMGFATGPVLWAPLSELKGRKMPLVISMFGFSIFEIAVATAKDLQTVLLCRFFAGFFGACPLAVVAAVFADMFNNSQRGLAITVFAITVFAGPLMAPFVGGFITESYLGWRWAEYITSFMGFLGFGLNVLFFQETYPPIILVEKAAELRRRTKNWGIHAKQEEIEVDFRELITENFTRPLRLLVTEPIVLLLSLYVAFLYGILYGLLTGYPIAFEEIRGWNAGVGGLPYFGLLIGIAIAGGYMILIQPAYEKKLKANNDVNVPEWRLPPIMYGGVSFAIGLFWFGWTGYKKDIHWLAPTFSGFATGFGFLTIFLQSLNYLVDAYLVFAASAIAANTIVRSAMASIFPLFATYMFDGMGLQWACTMLGCIAALFVPVPIIFYLYGAKIRARSKFAPTPPEQHKASINGSSSDEP
ncbi:MAG: hypothetical protein M1827_005353 [Pycnora praestabilis]|nr:MAG: hypothetical protein M1827_005353 [Pycnora praestabilis]